MKIYKEVPLDSIDLSNRNYLHSYPERSPFLIESLKEVGLLQPPLLLETPHGLIILCGEGRVKACLELEFDYLPCLILKDKHSDKDLLFIALQSNLFRPLNLVEKAIFFNKVYLFLYKEEIPKTLKLLNLPPHQNTVQILHAISKLNDNYKNLILNEKINPQILKYYENFGEESFFKLLNLCINFYLSFSEQRELFELASDLIRIEKLKEFLEELSQALSLEDYNQRKRAYKEVFMKFRYPFYSQKWKRLQETKSFFMAKGIEVQYVPYLEERDVEIRFKVEKVEDLEKRINFLKDYGREIFSLFDE